MHKKIIFSFLLILFLITSLISATTMTVKGKSGYNLTINVLNPLNNESAIPSVIYNDIGSSGQVNIEFSTGTSKANIIVIARVNGKIAKKKELYNVNVQTASPIIVELLDAPVVPKPAPKPVVQNPTPPPTPTPTPTVTPEPIPIPEPQANKTSFLTGMAISDINLSPTTKKIVIYSLIGVGIMVIIAIIVIIVIFIVKKHKKNKPISHDFKITKLSSLREPDSDDEIDEAEKRLKHAREEITRINEILNKRRAIKEAEKKIEEERKALERLRKS